MSGAATIRLVVGLGNPGSEYERTRHNAGFMVSGRLMEKLPGDFEKKKGFCGVYWQGRLRGRNLYVLHPGTFMNLSGKSVAAIIRSLDIEPREILAVHDDTDLPLGRIRFRRDGGSGGHHGIESLIAELGTTEFSRLRIGIDGEARKNQIDFVLGEFAAAELPLLERVLEVAADGIKLALYRGVGAAMNEYNGVNIKPEEENQTV